MVWPSGAGSKYDKFQRKSWTEKSSDFDNIYLIIWDNCSNIPTILKTFCTFFHQL